MLFLSPFLLFSFLKIATVELFPTISLVLIRSNLTSIFKTARHVEHLCICTLIDHGQRPITTRVAFTSLYKRPLPSSEKPHFQNEAENELYLHENEKLFT